MDGFYYINLFPNWKKALTGDDSYFKNIGFTADGVYHDLIIAGLW